MNRRWMRAAIALLAVGGVGGAGYLFATQRPLAVSIVEPAKDVTIRVFGLGTVEARIVSKIGFEAAGALAELMVDHGDSVAIGDILARLHSTEQEARVKRAEAAVLAGGANASKAEANVERALAVLEKYRENNRRKQSLVGSNIISQQAADEAQRDEDIAAAELTVARSEVEVANAMLADAQAALTYEKTLLDHHVLSAPFDGLIIERHKEAGSVVQAGDVILTLIAPETVWTLAYVDEARAGSIAEGQPAEVRLRSLPHQTFQARVSRIGIESDRANEERRVWVKCEQCPPRIHLGEQAEVRITTAQLDTALLVPEAAVSGFDGDKGTVWIVQDGRLSRIGVTFGQLSEDARLEVVSGLPDGARIVASIVPGLREGRMATVRRGQSQ